jgi:hypothetical protein
MKYIKRQIYIARVLDYEKIIVQAPITINMAHSEAQSLSIFTAIS